MSESSPNSTFTSRIENPRWARLLSLIWLVVAAFAVGMFVLSVPAEYQFFHDSPKWGGGFSSVLEQLHLSRNFLAGYTTIFDVLVVGLALALGVVIFRQRSNDWMALLVSGTMLVYAASLTLAFYLSLPFVAVTARIL